MKMEKRVRDDIGLIEMNVSERSHGNAFVGRSMLSSGMMTMNPIIFNESLGPSNCSLNGNKPERMWVDYNAIGMPIAKHGPVDANRSYELSASSEIEGRLA
jgi:hypothetical protein